MGKKSANPKHVGDNGCPPLPQNIAPILAALIKHGVGKPIQLADLRSKLPSELGSQEELPRRIRDLRKFGYVIPYSKKADSYTLTSDKPTNKRADTSGIPSRVAAQIRLAAHGQCQMCGNTIKDDGIRIVVDHRVPRDWGGSSTDPDNLWGICEPCNIAKQAFFSTLPKSVMEKCMTPREPIIRLGELLKVFHKKVCPRSLLEVVGADDEWPRRLRELRDLGWDVEHCNDPNARGRYRNAYKCVSWRPWPEDVGVAVREAAKKRGAKSFG